MEFFKRRKQIVENLDRLGYIKYPAVKRAMLKVKREYFVSQETRFSSYIDMPLPIPGGVTISAPHMHAVFLSALKLKPGDKVLEIGSGSGILLAYIKEIVGERGKVIGIEYLPETYEFAKDNLKKAGYDKKVHLILGDGSNGLPEEAPFDKIISSASCKEVPKSWTDQLKAGGILVTPMGPSDGYQELIYIEKINSGRLIKKKLGGVVFVELKGKYGWK